MSEPCQCGHLGSAHEPDGEIRPAGAPCLDCECKGMVTVKGESNAKN